MLLSKDRILKKAGISTNEFSIIRSYIKENFAEYAEAYPELILETIYSKNIRLLALLVGIFHAIRSYIVTGGLTIVFLHLLGPIVFASIPLIPRHILKKYFYIFVNNFALIWVPTWIGQSYVCHSTSTDPYSEANSLLLVVVIHMMTFSPKKTYSIMLALIAAGVHLAGNQLVYDNAYPLDTKGCFNALAVGLIFHFLISGLMRYKFYARLKRQEVESILEASPQGIFKLHLDSQGRIVVGSIHSRAASKIFGKSLAIAKMEFTEILTDRIQSESVRDNILALLKSCLNEDFTTFDFNRDSFPTELEVVIDQELRLHTVSWVPMIHTESGVIESILVSVSDVTDQRKIKSERDRIKIRRNCLIELTTAGKTLSSKFVRNAESSLNMSKQILEHGLTREAIDQVFVIVHSIKGNSHSLNFMQVTEIAHSFEQLLSKARRMEHPDVNKDHLLKEIDSLVIAIDQYKNVLEEDLAWNEEGEGRIELDQSDFEALIGRNKDFARKSISDLSSSSFSRALQQVYPSLSSLLLELASNSEDIAVRLGKPLPRVDMESCSVRFLKSGAQAVQTAFSHLMNNSLDHGLEDPKQRVTLGKSHVGKITVKASPLGGKMVLSWSDDGRGIDVEAIRKKANNAQIQCGSMSRQEVANLIFLPGFSTKDVASHVSGRGIGLHAVVDAFRKINGTVEVKLGQEISPGRFNFEIVMSIPIEQIFMIDEIPTTPIPAEQTDKKSNSSVHRPRILVIDDDEVQQMILARSLRRANYTVDIAKDRLSAIRMFSSSEYDLILVDVVLGEDCGFEVAKHLTDFGREKNLKTRIIGMTGTIFEDQEAKRSQSGMLKLLSKPLSMASIEEFVTRSDECEKSVS